MGLELVYKGHEVVILEMQERLVAEFIGIHRTALLDRMDQVGIRSLVRTTCKEIQANGVVVEDDEGNEAFLPSDTVVIGLGFKSRSEAAQQLRAAAGTIPVFEIGDCVRPAKVGEAVQEGYTAAMSIV